MPQITIDVPSENLPLFMELANALGIKNENIYREDKSPEWHKLILNERLVRYQSGNTQAKSWDEFGKDLDKDEL